MTVWGHALMTGDASALEPRSRVVEPMIRNVLRLTAPRVSAAQFKRTCTYALGMSKREAEVLRLRFMADKV